MRHPERYAWLFFVAVTVVNALIFWVRSRRHVARDPSLEDGYRTLIRGMVIWGNIPWLIMGFGCLVGGVPTMDHYFRPRDGNPFVLAFFASWVLIWALGTHWLFARGGAEMIVRHPGILNVDIKNPIFIKLYWCLCLAGGIGGAIAMFLFDVPLPDHQP